MDNGADWRQQQELEEEAMHNESITQALYAQRKELEEEAAWAEVETWLKTKTEFLGVEK
jgi:hypothetical protein